MQYLIDFAERDEEFGQISRRAAEFKSVQGLVLAVDKYWLACWRVRQQFGSEALERAHDFGLPFPWGWLSETIPPHVANGENIINWDEFEHWKPPRWDRWREIFGGSRLGPPIIVRVCLRPRRNRDERVPKLEDLTDRKGRLSVEIVTYPQAELASAHQKVYRPLRAGTSIGTTRTEVGTLGVLMRDGSGKYYATTCAHVAQSQQVVTQPGVFDDPKAQAIGRSTLVSPLVSCGQFDPCTPDATTPAHDIDVALMELDPGIAQSPADVLSIGPLTAISPRVSVSPEREVLVSGRSSGCIRMQVGGVAVWYRFKWAGKYYCFKNLFQVQSLIENGPRIQGGDSGAPVCIAGPDGQAWCGMIVGRDSVQGYAAFSQTIADWLSAKGYILALA